MDKVVVDYQQNMSFVANVDDFKIEIDAKLENGGQGLAPTPKPFMLIALAGCTGMDVASLASKMRVGIEKLTIEVSAEKTETIPTVYTSVDLTYNFISADENIEKIRKIVDMSQERYCGVAAMFRMICPLNYSIVLNGKPI